jgi:AcrR family transcriptional regulator
VNISVLRKQAVPGHGRAGQWASERICSLNEGLVTKRTKKRTYRLSARAESQAETRLRIVEAAVHLHEKLGPARTTVSAIAARAGVQRLTLYRHFPDDRSIFAACTAHWSARHPFPDAAQWDGIADPAARARAAVGALLRYYAGTSGMWRAVHRDVGALPVIQPVVARFEAHLTALADSLSAGFRAKGARRRAIAATLRHALSFSTWDNLEDGGVNTDAKIALVLQWLDGVRKPSA